MSSRHRRRLCGRNRGDDLERRDDDVRTQTGVAGGDIPSTLHRGLDGLFAEHAEVGIAGVSVDGDESTSRKQHLTAAGKFSGGGATVLVVVDVTALAGRSPPAVDVVLGSAATKRGKDENGSKRHSRCSFPAAGTP